MAKILTSFLGRSPKQEGHYRTTRYDFGDGGPVQECAFFGWALQQRVQPQRFVILGTAGSMWDHLFEGDLDLGAREEDKRLALVEAVEQKRVQQSQLDQLAPLLTEHLGCEVQLRLISYSREEHEQTRLLETLAASVQPGDELHLDVTHAFRHLPMIGLMGALYLRLLRRISIQRIWYGAYDPDTGSSTVHDLAGLLRIADWLQALSIYDQKGDYSALANLLEGELAEHLRDAAFLEQVNRIGQARGRARKALTQLRAQPFTDPTAELFRPALISRLEWAEQGNFYQRQRALALRHLQQGNLLEAVLGGYEAFISRQTLQRGLNPDQLEAREQAREAFDEAQKNISPRPALYKQWDQLRRLRNAVIHGGQARGDEVQRALSSYSETKQLLERLFDRLLPETLEP